jgi:hypothetical protein
MAAIVDADIDFKKAGASTGTTPVAGVDPSIGNRVSTVVMPSTINQLFDQVSAAENEATHTDYRVVYFHNKNTANAAQNVRIWMDGGDPAGGATVTLAMDSTAASAYTGTNAAQAVSATNETTGSQTSLTYSAAIAEGSAINLGTVNSGFVKAFWIKRVVNNVAAINETLTLRYKLETAAA